MTKKDYIRIARAIFNSPIDDDARGNIVLELSAELKMDNPEFDSNKFSKACGIEDGRC